MDDNTIPLNILAVLMQRDGLHLCEAQELLNDARQQVANGSDPEEVLLEEFGLEPDYIFDLL